MLKKFRANVLKYTVLLDNLIKLFNMLLGDQIKWGNTELSLFLC